MKSNELIGFNIFSLWRYTKCEMLYINGVHNYDRSILQNVHGLMVGNTLNLTVDSRQYLESMFFSIKTDWNRIFCAFFAEFRFLWFFSCSYFGYLNGKKEVFPLCRCFFQFFIRLHVINPSNFVQLSEFSLDSFRVPGNKAIISFSRIVWFYNVFLAAMNAELCRCCLWTSVKKRG